jgi:hypothetical protein
MESRPGAVPPKELVRLLKEFFEGLRAQDLQQQHCSDCGAPLTRMETQFWLEGESLPWNVPLLFCLHCHPEIAARLKFTP